MKKVWYVCKMEYYYSAMHRAESCVGKWIELKHIMLSETSQTQKDKSHTFFVIHRNKQGEIDGWVIKDRLLRKGIRGRGRRK